MSVGVNKMPTIVPSNTLNRFWGKVKITANPTICWEWAGSTNKMGYGYITIKNDEGKFVKFKAHRISYYLHYNKDPHSLLVMHKCDNPKCCNPQHLDIGTDKTNADDREVKGRGNKGESNGHAKWTENQILEMRRLYSEGISTKELAEKYGTYANSIYCIVTKRYWKHI